MLNSKGERELAYVVSIDNITPMNADRLECAHIGGWHCVVGKGEFKVGDKAVYFEIDSQLPEKEPFASMEFLKSKHFKIKSQKIRGEISQGLLVSFDSFGWPQDKYEVGDFLTSALEVTYALPEDNIRKSNRVNLNGKYNRMATRNKWLFKYKFFRNLMKKDWGKKLLFFIFGRKRDLPKRWPEWVVKTDEERIQNIPWILNEDGPWTATEKIDGTSATYTMRRTKRNKKEFLVCSRNMVYDKLNPGCFYEKNHYTGIAEKYNIEKVLETILDRNPNWKWVTLQGEIFGPGIQKRDYSLKELQFRAFNLIDSEHGRWNSYDASTYMKPLGIDWMPILDVNYTLPETVEEVLEFAEGKSVIDGKEREGIVFRNADATRSFKAVSNSYLLKYHS